MRGVLKKYQDVVYTVLTVIDVIAAAAVVDRVAKDEIVPWGIVLFGLLSLSIAAHVVLYRQTRATSKKDQVAILDNVLEIAARALVFPESWDAVTIRSYFHSFDRNSRTLHYIAGAASDKYDDQFTDIPVDALDDDGQRVFVIADAIVSGGTRFRKLPKNRSPAEDQRHVWEDIGCVLACPVHAPEMPKCEDTCLGVVSFDTSTRGGEKVHLDKRRAKDIIAGVARTAGLLWS